MSARDDMPPRLIEEKGQAGELLRRFARHGSAVSSEAAAWDRMIERLAAPNGRPRVRLAFATTFGALAGAVGLYLFLPQISPVSEISAPVVKRVVSEDPAPLPEAVREAVGSLHALPREGAVAVALDVLPVRLQAGASTLFGEGKKATVITTAHTVAHAFSRDQESNVELVRGAVELDVDKQDQGRHFHVLAHGYRFTVLGTRFRLSHVEGGTSLTVHEGRVAVFQKQRQIALVTGGESWRSPSRATETPESASPAARTATVSPAVRSGTVSLAARTAAVPPAARLESVPHSPPSISVPLSPQAGRGQGEGPLAPPALTLALAPRSEPQPAAGCADLESRNPRGAHDCFVAQSAGTGLLAEVALYQVARLRRDALADLPGALSTLHEHRRRFPSGTLRHEVDLSMAELLPKLGRHREAMEETAALLRTALPTERAAELHLMRGQILRDVYSDWEAAEREYAAAAEGTRGRKLDASLYGRAVVLARMGRVDDAKTAFERYLVRPGALRVGDARSELNALCGGQGCPARP